MSETTVDAWLRSRTPEIPPVLLLQLLEDDERPVSSNELAHRGQEALTKALKNTGRDRARAYHLLAADAFFTYACEALTRTEDLASGLEALLERLGAEFR